tara:strand:- start:2847 stop:3047 length:201 start_codon:yes stop_codon:yes gene_type:complete
MMSKFKDWVIDEQEKEDILDTISDELSGMNVDTFSNLVDEHDLGIEMLDDIFYQLRDKLYEERSKK